MKSFAIDCLNKVIKDMKNKNYKRALINIKKLRDLFKESKIEWGDAE
jgi:hypothetical protein